MFILKNVMKNVEIFETSFPGNDGKVVKMTILRATVLPTTDPLLINRMMDAAVSEYVQNKGHNTFVECHDDTPNLRIIISDLNDVVFEDEHL